MNGVLLRRGNLGTYSKDNVKTESRQPTKKYKIYKERKYASYSRKKAGSRNCSCKQTDATSKKQTHLSNCYKYVHSTEGKHDKQTKEGMMTMSVSPGLYLD